MITVWVLQFCLKTVTVSGAFSVILSEAEQQLSNPLDQEGRSLMPQDEAGEVAIPKPYVGDGSWTAQDSGTTNVLYGLTFVDGGRGAAVGERGTILTTNNGGTTWAPQKSGIADGLIRVKFVDANTGWAVGFFGVVLKTLDGGATWKTQRSGGQDLHSVDFVDAFHGWAVGMGGTIFRTVNGGAQWTSVGNDPGVNFVGVKFCDGSTGWVVGWKPNNGGIVLKTSDGGQSWSTQHVAKEYLTALAFADMNTGWVVGWGSTILKTSDSGKTWLSVSSPIINDYFRDVYFASKSTGWVVGDPGSTEQANLIATADGGGSWTALHIPVDVTDQLWGVFSPDTVSFVVVGKAGTIVSWKPNTPTPYPATTTSTTHGGDPLAAPFHIPLVVWVVAAVVALFLVFALLCIWQRNRNLRADAEVRHFFITECGLREFVGEYVADGRQNGRTRYRKEDGGGQTCNYWDGAWFLAKRYRGVWYESEQCAAATFGCNGPPQGGWQVGANGIPPPPTISYAAATDVSLRLRLGNSFRESFSGLVHRSEPDFRVT